MQKLENKTLQIFLDRFVDGLKSELGCNNLKNDQLDIPFIISSLYQSFKNHTDIFKDFIQDLCLYPDYNISILDYPKYNYKLCFAYDTRNYGYCECTPDMPDYREDKHCCGHGCDAAFCKFSLHKVLHIASGSWEGDEHDYWEFEDEFYLSDKELDEKKEKEDREREIEELKNRIEADQKRLAELEVNKYVGYSS